uniref:HTH-type transcriptional regulator n=1 Tax=Leclercia sp. TaxID=1898428 RepID=UPI0028A8CD5E
ASTLKSPSYTKSVSWQHYPFTEFERLRKGTGMKTDDFARAMGVSVAMVQEWESKRVKPSMTELKLMSLIQANPALRKQLTE